MSKLRCFYWVSIACFLLSLASPDGSTLFMLVFGYLAFAMGFSVAWVANPLLIAAYLLVPRVRNPWNLRWLLYLAFAAMLRVCQIEPSIPVELLPFFAFWLVAPVILYIGLLRCRNSVRKLQRADAWPLIQRDGSSANPSVRT